jgi:hypothetical protein
MTSSGWTPSIAPLGDQTFYLVINNYGHSGTAFAKADVGEAVLETVISDLMNGDYNDPVRVVAFNTAEHWAEDASASMASEPIATRACSVMRDSWLRSDPTLVAS